MGPPIRVLVADDSPLAREVLRALLESDPGIRVVGEAGDGLEAAAMARALKPDLVTMDLRMPVMDGIEAIAEIMAISPVPILVVSAHSDAKLACEALARGALDVVGKPDLGDGPAFVAKVRLLAGVRVITHMRHAGQAMEASTAPAAEGRFRVFAVASSTGGPQALSELLGALPAEFPGSMVVAQHIADGFAEGLAEWLAGQCRIAVRLAQSGEALQPGTAFISPSETNLAVMPSGRLWLEERSGGQVYRPSCDVLLSSVAYAYRARSVGVILTGMGHDGVAGLGRIATAGGVTLAQDESSSAIFGMNRAAIEAGHVQKVLALPEMAAEMRSLAASGG